MPRLGELLLDKTLITEEQRQRAALRQSRHKGRFGTALLEEGASEEVILWGLTVQHRVPPASPEALELIRADVLRLVPGRVAQRLRAVPFRKDGRNLSVAMRDPGDLAGLDVLGELTGFRIVPHAALEVRIYALLYRFYAADVEPRYLSAAAYLRETQPVPAEDADEPTEPARGPRPRSRPDLKAVPPPPPDLSSPYPQRTRHFDQGDPWQSAADLSPVASLAATARRMENEIYEDPLESLDPEPDSMEFPHRVEDPAPAAEAAETAGDERFIALLAAAQSRDDIAVAVLEDALRHVKRAALFVAHPDHVRGWASRPEAPEFKSFQLPDSEPSVFATLRNTEGFYVGPQPDLPGTAATLQALASSGIGTMAVVPVNLKGKTVLYLYGEAGTDDKPPSIPALKRLAAMAATALEIVLLKRRLGRL